jgi:DNA-binding transcriptional LysR family regulator
LLEREKPDEERGLWRRVGGEAFHITPRYVGNDLMQVADLAEAGHGIALLPQVSGLFGDVFANLILLLTDEVGGWQDICVSLPTVLLEVPKLRLIRDSLASLAFREEQNPPSA